MKQVQIATHLHLHRRLLTLLLLTSATWSALANDGGAGMPVPAETAPPGTTPQQDTAQPAVEPGPSAAVDASTSTAGPSNTAASPPVSVAAGTAAQAAATGVPDRCIIAGSALFSSCAREIATAQNRFNLTVDVIAPQNYTQLLSERGVTRDQAIDALREILAQPSESCCNASCAFNQLLLCDCEPAVLEVAVRFAGADLGFYAMLIEQLAAGCKQHLYFNQSCPADTTEALLANGVVRSGNAYTVTQGECTHTGEGDGRSRVASSWEDSNAAVSPLSPAGMYGDNSGAGYGSSMGEYGGDSSTSSAGMQQATNQVSSSEGSPGPGAPPDPLSGD